MERYKKVIRVLVFLIIFLSLIFYFIFLNNPSFNLQTQITENKENLNKYFAENVSINKKIGNKTSISIHAGSITYRKRTSELFDYQNLKEIYIENAEIDIYNNSPGNKSNRDLALINRLFDSMDTFCSYQSLIKNNRKNHKADIETELLSRILFDNINFKIHYPAQKSIFFHASNAEINYNVDNIVLNGNVIIKDNKNNEYYAKTAVFSEKYNGFYFPQGFVHKQYKTNNKNFYALNNSGEIIHVKYIPEIIYVDMLSKSEKELFLKFVRKLPPQLRILLGLSNLEQDKIYKQANKITS